MPIDPLDDVAAPSGLLPPEGPTATLSSLVLRLRERQALAVSLEQKLKETQAAIRELEMVLIPDMMLSLQIQSIGVSYGGVDATLKLEPFLSASLAGKAMNGALAWLKSTGQDGLIKTEVTVLFGKGERQRAEALAGQIRGFGWMPEVSETVNTGAFKALVREWMEQGKSLPVLEDIGVFAGKRATFITKEKQP